MIGSFPNKIVFILSAIALVGAGCTDTITVDSQASTASSPIIAFEEQQVPLQGNEFAHVRPDRVIIVHAPSQETIATVIAKQPRALRWSKREQALYWIESASLTNAPDDDAHTVIRRLDTTTGKVESIYWSRGQMTDLFVSQATDILAFVREDTLYTLNPSSGSIHRAAEFVEDAVWSPSDTAFVVSQRKSAVYMTVDQTGAITTRTPLLDGKRFSGVTFVDGKTVLGLQWNEDTVVLRSINLQSSQGQRVGVWSNDPTDGANDRHQIAVGPESSGVMVYQSFSDASGGVLWQWNPETEKRERLTNADHLLGWTDPDTVWYTASQDDVTRMYSYDVQSGITSERIQSVDAPILIEYTEE